MLLLRVGVSRYSHRHSFCSCHSPRGSCLASGALSCAPLHRARPSSLSWFISTLVVIPSSSLVTSLLSHSFNVRCSAPSLQRDSWIIPSRSLPWPDSQVYFSVHGQSLEIQACIWICSVDISIWLSNRLIRLHVSTVEFLTYSSQICSYCSLVLLIKGTNIQRTARRKNLGLNFDVSLPLPCKSNVSEKPIRSIHSASVKSIHFSPSLACPAQARQRPTEVAS